VGKIIDIQGAAELLAVDYKTVYRLIQSGDLPAAKIGRVYRLARDDVERYFEQRKAATMRRLRANGRSDRAARLRADGDDASSERRCAWCGRELVLNYSVAAECDEPGCEAVICRECARTDNATRCPAHAAPNDRNEHVERLRADGVVVVSSEEVRTLAASYLVEVAERVERLSCWPGDGASVVPRERLAVSVRQNPAADQWLALDGGEPVPFEAEVSRRGRIRGGRALLKAVVVAAVHRSAYERHGFDVQSCTAADLRALLARTRLDDKNAGHNVVALWSPTGWSDQAVAQAEADPGTSGRIVLVDRPAGRCVGAEGWVAYLLDARSDEPAIAACAEFVRDALALRSSVRLDTAVEEGGFHHEIVHRCFDRLAGGGDCVVDRFDELGVVISRR
jgi:excisionase family DNA binding protein